MDVLTSGYVSMDHIIKIDRPARIGFTSLVTNPSNSVIRYGGCSVNIAYALCRLGISSMPVLRVGPDYETNGFKSFLEEGGVSLDAATVVESETTSTCYLLEDNNNDHITVFYPGAMNGCYAKPLPDHLFAGLKLGVITVASCQDNKYFFEQCLKHEVPIAFGMKADFDAFPKDFLKRLLEESKIIFMNLAEKEEIKAMYGLTKIEQLFDHSRAQFLVTTLGKAGSICYSRLAKGIRQEEVGACFLDKIIDATGAGDAYIAGFLYGYLKGCPPADCCRLGSAMSYFVLQAEGCCTNLPTEQELLAKAALQAEP